LASRFPRVRGAHVSVLLAGGMNDAAHNDLCEAAVAAASGLPVRLSFRDHPLYPFASRPAFRRFEAVIAVASGTLNENLEAADLVLFSQSGIAEEALLRGVPAWQWLWPGCNTSAFLDVRVVPTFTSVAALRRELETFVSDPARYQPTPDTQRRVLHECFGPDPAGAATRMADAIVRLLGADVGHVELGHTVGRDSDRVRA